MEVQYTPSQQRVIDLRDCNILVSAAAGSGKTAVLVERIIRRVLDERHPIDIDRILVLTYTNAAAGEMKERIRQAIMKELTKHPESIHLQRQASLIHNAQITTMHSFNLFLVRNHFNEIGLDPAFRIAKEGELKLLSGEVLEELLEEAFEKREENFEAFLNYFPGNGSAEEITREIIRLAELANSYPFPEEWLRDRKMDYLVEEDSTEVLTGPAMEYLERYIDAVLGQAVDTYRKIISLIQSPAGPYMYGEMVEQELEIVQNALDQKGWNQKRESLSNLSFGTLSGKKDDTVDSVLREQAKTLRNNVKKSLLDLKEDFLDVTPQLSLEQTRCMKKPMDALLDLTCEYLRRMKEAKAERKVIDFGDMEHFALEILVKREGEELVATQVAREYRSYFEEIMTDEYQDSNLVQETILNVLSGQEEGRYNRFMVGDVKQSIYKFRLARPELFLEKLESYQEEGPCTKVILSQNFRSRQVILQSVNDVFSRLMSKEKGGIVYDEDASLHPGAVYPEYEEAGTEFLFVEAPGEGSEVSAREAEILAIGNKILWLMEHYRVTDKKTGELRPVCFSDIVILMRSTSGVEDRFKQLLGEKGIPVYTESKKGYFESKEIQTLLNVLKVLDNPTQDIPLYGVLTSLFGGFTEEELAVLCSQREKGSSQTLYQTLKEHIEEEKVGRFLDWLERYRSLVIYTPIRDLLELLTEEADYLDYVAALPLGARRKANVEMLFTKASEFAQTNYSGLFHFVRYIEKLKSYDEDYGEADLLDENAQVVRLMSIHKSKGLEFPITFVAGLDKRFNRQDIQKNLVADMDLGLGVKYQNNFTRVRNTTLRHRVIVKKLIEDAVGEELRVLYVAMTRAKEKLFLSAVCKDADKLSAAIEEERAGGEEATLSYGAFLTAKSYLDFLLPVLSGCEIHLSVVEATGVIREEVEDIEERWERRERLNAWEREPEVVGRRKILREKFSRTYPHGDLEGLVAKTTVSELKIAAMSDRDEEAFHAFEEKEVEEYIPTFAGKKEEVTGTKRGNAYHRVMELFHFRRFFEELLGLSVDTTYLELKEKTDEALVFKGVETHLEELRCEGVLQEEYETIVDKNKLVYFLLSELGYRMWKAMVRDELYREQPFVLGISASELNPDFPKEEQVLIQGIIDAYFYEEGKIVLLDYKTDSVPDMEALWNRYETQISYYTRALEQLTCKEVTEKYLYSFKLNSCGSKP